MFSFTAIWVIYEYACHCCLGTETDLDIYCLWVVMYIISLRCQPQVHLTYSTTYKEANLRSFFLPSHFPSVLLAFSSQPSLLCMSSPLLGIWWSTVTLPVCLGRSGHLMHLSEFWSRINVCRDINFCMNFLDGIDHMLLRQVWLICPIMGIYRILLLHASSAKRGIAVISLPSVCRWLFKLG